jgi:uncharacterized protein (DUF1697 family)
VALVSRKLPFDAEIIICEGRDVVALLSHAAFAEPAQTDIVRFVSVLSRLPADPPQLPITLPPRGKWVLKVHAREACFVFGMYRRDMKAIGHLGRLDRLFGVPATTRNWNTIAAITKVLNANE